MTGAIIKPKGFSLVEVLVAVAIFAVAAVLALDLLTNYIKVQAQLSKQQVLSSDLQFIMQSLTVDLREGRIDYDYYAQHGISLDTNVLIIALRDVYGQQILYELKLISPGQYQLYKQGAALQRDSYLKQGLFYIRPMLNPDSGSSDSSTGIFINIIGAITDTQAGEITETIQTIISSRTYGR